jgi:hypothetical protein
MDTQVESVSIKLDMKSVNLEPHSRTFLMIKIEENVIFITTF